MDPHASDGHADDESIQRDARKDLDPVVPGQLATPVDSAAGQDEIGSLSSKSIMDRVQNAPWLSGAGGPAVLYRAYYDYDPSAAGALVFAEHLIDLCRPRGVTVEIEGVDSYNGIDELRGVHGVFCVFSSAPQELWRPDNTARFRRIVRDFRAIYPLSAVDGFYPDSDRWHRVGVIEAFYTDHALGNPDCLEVIQEACAGHPYAPGMPFTGQIFEVFEPGKAQRVKENDQIAANNVVLWKKLRRWGVDSGDRAQLIRDETEREVDALEDPGKRAMYRPIPGRDHNQLWLVLHDTGARPPIDPDKTTEENHEAAEKFVANSARAVRNLVKRLEETYEWFRQPEDLKRRGAQHHFARLYQALRNVRRS